MPPEASSPSRGLGSSAAAGGPRDAHGLPSAGLSARAPIGARGAGLEVQTGVLHGALRAQWLRLANTPAVQDQRVRRARPSFLRQHGAELLLDHFRIVGLGDAEAVRDAQDVAVDRQ